jgi:hypothetical protein
MNKKTDRSLSRLFPIESSILIHGMGRFLFMLYLATMMSKCSFDWHCISSAFDPIEQMSGRVF